MRTNRTRMKSCRVKVVLDKKDLLLSKLKFAAMGFIVGIFPMVIMAITNDTYVIPWPLVLMAPAIFILGVLTLAIFLFFIQQICVLIMCKHDGCCEERNFDENSSHGAGKYGV